MTKDEIKNLANQIMFDLSDQEIKDLENDFLMLDKYIDILNKIDTNGVEDMDYPFSNETCYLREDVVSDLISQEEALSNASNTSRGHFVVPRVVG